MANNRIPCVAILIAGIVRGKSHTSALSLQSVSAVVLFWVSVVGIAAVVAILAAMVGIAATFDERTDTANGFDTVWAISRNVGGACCALAWAAHCITAVWRTGPGKDAEPANPAYRR